MSKIEYLREQAARAERLAKTVMDALTAQRLQAFAAECRREIKTQAENERPLEIDSDALFLTSPRSLRGEVVALA
jgi:hypothetical protein